MKMPGCFYTKAFWIVVPILFASMGSSILAVNNQIQASAEYDHDQDNRITQLEQHLNDKYTIMYGNQMVICEAVGAKCK